MSMVQFVSVAEQAGLKGVHYIFVCARVWVHACVWVVVGCMLDIYIVEGGVITSMGKRKRESLPINFFAFWCCLAVV